MGVGGGLLTVQTEMFSPRSVTLFIPSTSEVWERLGFLLASGAFVKAFWGELGGGWILAHWSSHGLGCIVCLQGLTSGESSHHKFTTSGCFTQ